MKKNEFWATGCRATFEQPFHTFAIFRVRKTTLPKRRKTHHLKIIFWPFFSFSALPHLRKWITTHWVYDLVCECDVKRLIKCTIQTKQALRMKWLRGRLLGAWMRSQAMRQCFIRILGHRRGMIKVNSCEMARRQKNVFFLIIIQATSTLRPPN